MYTLQFDGLFRSVAGKPNPASKAGLMSYGWLILKNNTIIARGHGAFASLKHATSNTAEYLALIEGLEALLDLGLRQEPVLILGDSKCVIDQMSGLAHVNAPTMKLLNRRARQLSQLFTGLTWSWFPRKENFMADSLTRYALRQVHADTQAYQDVVKSLRSGKRSQELFQPLLNLCIYHPR